MKVSIIGTVGIPANYGGFETLVEQLVRHNQSGNFQYTVYCSTKSYPEQHQTYQGANLKYVNLKANGAQSILYDIISLIKAAHTSEVVLVLGVSGCIFLPIFRLFSKKRLIINIDGLEHRRDKWGKFTRRFLKYSEKMAVKYGDVIVTDNQGITDYVKDEYGMCSELIAYGGDHVITQLEDGIETRILSDYNLTSNGYSLAICRIEPENNVHTILEAFSHIPDERIVFIGNWDKSEYGVELKEKYAGFPNIIIKPAIYDIKVLNVLRSNCKYYLHGHSAGGTNPSLVEAMFFRKPIYAFDCIYNRESTENKAEYFSSAEDLELKLNDKSIDLSSIASSMYDIADRRYRWSIIAKQYENLYCAQPNLIEHI